ncbi:MAG: DUF6795 domain-containing protein [Bdellovibrionales bacterium]
MAKVCLFSEVDGIVFLHGKPVEGADVERQYEWAWGGKTFTDKVVTDANGAFHFSPAFKSMILGSVLPHQPVITQTINITHDQKSVRVWAYAKMLYDENSELGGKPIKISCYLDREPTHFAEKITSVSPYGPCELRE